MPYEPSDPHGLGDAYSITLANEQAVHVVNERELIEAARRVLADSRFRSATISLAVVDDATIHDLNRRYLAHDWPTDVLSFGLGEHGDHLEGEVVISAETAAAEAEEIGWPAAAEQLLYVIHGMLHLVGYHDASLEEQRTMRAAEAKYLRLFGIQPTLEKSGGTLPVSPWRAEHRKRQDLP